MLNSDTFLHWIFGGLLEFQTKEIQREFNGMLLAHLAQLVVNESANVGRCWLRVMI